MSLPPEKRRRKKGDARRRGKGTISQMDHANGSEQNKRRREFFRKNKR